MSRDTDELEATAFQAKQWLKPILDLIKAAEDVARRQKQAAQPGPVRETVTPPSSAA